MGNSHGPHALEHQLGQAVQAQDDIGVESAIQELLAHFGVTLSEPETFAPLNDRIVRLLMDRHGLEIRTTNDGTITIERSDELAEELDGYPSLRVMFHGGLREQARRDEFLLDWFPLAERIAREPA